ncbi:MAG: hypothetical protein AABX31_03000 [Nanoarchaeota archaeon]
MHYKVFHSTTFDKELSKYPKEFNEWLEKIKNQLIENPYVGDQLRVKWFREKKHGKFRGYYLIYDDLKTVYLVAISAKNDQQIIIDTIWLLLDNFKEEIENLLK